MEEQEALSRLPVWFRPPALCYGYLCEYGHLSDVKESQREIVVRPLMTCGVYEYKNNPHVLEQDIALQVFAAACEDRSDLHRFMKRWRFSCRVLSIGSTDTLICFTVKVKCKFPQRMLPNLICVGVGEW